MAEKVKWYGEISSEYISWLSFAVQEGKGYEYNDMNRPSKIIVTADDNDGISPEDIFF